MMDTEIVIFPASPRNEKINGICPNCNKKLTIGVDYRVEEIAKEKKGYIPQNAKPFFKLIPLHELIALVYKTPMESNKSGKSTMI